MITHPFYLGRKHDYFAVAAASFCFFSTKDIAGSTTLVVTPKRIKLLYGINNFECLRHSKIT